MEDCKVQQKNISSYFSGTKRTNSDCLTETKPDVNNFSEMSKNPQKRQKKNEVVKIGESVNYTINKFFNFKKEESCISELKLSLQNLEINKKINLNINNNEANLERYFKRVNTFSTSFDGDSSNRKNYNKNYEMDVQKVFSLDNIELTGKAERGQVQNYSNNLNESFYSVNNHYEDTKITNWVKYTTYSEINGLNETLFQNILKYLPFKEITKTCSVNKTFWNFYRNLVNNYFYFSIFDTSKVSSGQELMEILKKTKSLKHLQKLNEIIKLDFGEKNTGQKIFITK